MKLKKICVYCGSASGKRPQYSEAAESLAQAMVEREIGLVYGGAKAGIMGKIADKVLALGGEVIGVIPTVIQQKELAHTELTQLIVVDSMQERKATLAEISDGFIALPGGFGTMDELFEILTWAQLGFHTKPCGLLNIEDYYQHLSAFLNHASQEGFVKSEHKDLLMIEKDISKLLQRMDKFWDR